MEHKQSPLPVKKRIALVAHDNKKDELCQWALRHREILKEHAIYATGTTGYLLEHETGLHVTKFISGPLGGDQQVGARVANSEIDLLFFFWDPFEQLPHDPDVKALLRIAAVWNIPVACNPASADFILSSPLLTTPYERAIPDYDAYIRKRTKNFL